MSDAGATLRATPRLLRTPALALVLLGGLAALAEGLVHVPAIARHLPAQSRVPSYPLLEAKMDRLESFIRREGGVDCLFLGNSMVKQSVDPEVFVKAYQERTGRKLRCFNFGLSGSTETGIEILLPMLLARARPALVVIGTAGVQIDAEFGSRTEQVLRQEPWIRRLLGEPTLDGWLMEHAKAFRHFMGLHRWLNPRFRKSRLNAVRGMSATGFGGGDVTPRVLDFKVMPPPDQLPPAIARLRAGETREDRRAFEALARMIDAIGPRRVVLFESPLHPSCETLLGEIGMRPHNRGTAAIADVARRRSVPFLRTWHTLDVPDSGWWDRWHLTPEGAAQFSRWLAERVANLAARGDIQDPGRAP